MKDVRGRVLKEGERVRIEEDIPSFKIYDTSENKYYAAVPTEEVSC